jgi:hypothetical protein
VGAQRGVVGGGGGLHRGPLGAVDQDGAVFDEAEGEELAFVDAIAEAFAEEGAEDFQAAVGREKIRRHDRGAEEVVVVEIEKAFGNAGEEMEPTFDDVAVEGGERGGIGADFVVMHEAEAGMLAVQPSGHLRAAGEEVDVAHPRGVEGERAEAVAEEIAGIAEALGVEIAGAAGVAVEERAVIGAAAVDPRVDGIDGSGRRHGWRDAKASENGGRLQRIRGGGRVGRRGWRPFRARANT